MERDDGIKGAVNLRQVLLRADAHYPNLAFDLITELIKLQSSKQINLNEMLLRSEKITTSDEYFIKRPEFKELNQRASQLKLILSRIPDEINDRKAFLETIK
jgi:programmed cell death protein 10